MSQEDVYVRLCHSMNEHPVGAPETEEFLAILRTFYTPEEAEMAIHLKAFPEDLATIATNAGRPEEEVGPMLEAMADKGLLFKDSDQGLYHGWSTCPGLWEISFAKGERNPRDKFLAKMWREYYKNGWSDEMQRTKTPLTRVNPVRQAFKPEQKITVYEEAVEILEKCNDITVINCPCRMAADLDGDGCGQPTDVCLILGYLAKFLAEKGFGRKITPAEAVDILKKTDEAGLVHVTMNTKDLGDDALGICSCCRCCCSQLRATTEFGKPIGIAKSRFIPVVSEDECVMCEACVPRCPMSAITVDGAAAQVDLEKCIGCGLCVTGCPTSAFTLEEKPDYTQPMADLDELFQTFLQEKAAGISK